MIFDSFYYLLLCSAGQFKIKEETNQGTWKVYTAKIRKLYKGSNSIKTSKVDLWVSNSCSCPRIRKGRTYLVMGMAGNRIVLDDNSFVRNFPNSKKEKDEYLKLNRRLETFGC